MNAAASETAKVQAVLAERMSGFPLVGGEPSSTLGKHSGGVWRRSPKVGDAVVGTEPTSGFGALDRNNEVYGGFLVAESVSPENLPTIAAAPVVLAALVELYSVVCDMDDDAAEGRDQKQLMAFADRWVAAIHSAEVAMSLAGGAL